MPWVTIAFLNEAFPEPVLDVPWNATLAEATKILGQPMGKRAANATDEETVTYWERDLGGGVVLDVSFEDSLLVAIEISGALGLSEDVTPGVSVFFVWAATKGLLDEKASGAHAPLIAQLKQRKAEPAQVAKVALPRGLWDAHLKNDAKLRITAYRWFHNRTTCGSRRTSSASAASARVPTDTTSRSSTRRRGRRSTRRARCSPRASPDGYFLNHFFSSFSSC